MNYKQAFDKITEAYIKGEIKPFDNHFCFCGSLANNRSVWQSESTNGYSVFEFKKMEEALLDTISKQCFGINTWISDLQHFTQDYEACQNYEDALFAGMSAALDVLKQIHIERGEVIDEVPVFAKRELV